MSSWLVHLVQKDKIVVRQNRKFCWSQKVKRSPVWARSGSDEIKNEEKEGMDIWVFLSSEDGDQKIWLIISRRREEQNWRWGEPEIACARMAGVGRRGRGPRFNVWPKRVRPSVSGRPSGKPRPRIFNRIVEGTKSSLALKQSLSLGVQWAHTHRRMRSKWKESRLPRFRERAKRANEACRQL